MKRRTPLLPALLLAGCASLLPLQPPEVSLVNLEFTDLTVFETTGVFTVRISNANPEPMVLDGAVYRLYLNGQRVGKGLSSQRLEVPRLETVTDEVTLHVDNLALATRVVDMIQTRARAVDYRIRAKLYVVGSWGTRRIKADYEGRLDFDEMTAQQPEVADG